MEHLYINSTDQLNWKELTERNRNDALCIVDNNLRHRLNGTRIEQGFREDVIHAGLLFYEPTAFQRISLGALVWFFLRPASKVKSTSWMASAHIVILKQGVLDKVQVNTWYTSTHMVVADLAFQVLKGGGLVAYNPDVLVSHPGKEYATAVSGADLRLFLLRYFGLRACLAAFPFSPGVIAQSKKIKKMIPAPLGFCLLDEAKHKNIDGYTAVIPTLNRYAYLKKAIKSLLDNSRPPAEIVVVDQTPVASRVGGYYDEFDPAVVKVFFLDKAGQSTARNHAIRQATYNWILFWDDDSETWDDMITEHIRLLEYSVADVSTGVSLAPWKDKSYINREIGFYQVVAVMDTGNCMMHKSLVENVGMFDPAFDKGSGADDNLGKRLFLKGACIVFNPKAIRTHHKAPMGGLRTHGAWWKNKGTYFGPFPLSTESYDFLRFYPKGFYLRLCLYRLLTSYRRSGIWMNLLNTVLFPVKVWVSYRRAKTLFQIGISTGENTSGN